MRTTVMREAARLTTLESGPISKLAADAVRAGNISAAKLKTLLTEGGYSVTYHEGPGETAPEGTHPHGAWVLVRLEGQVVAQAYSHDEEDALLQAIYAAMREEEGAAVVATELDARGLKVTPELRQQLESRYITGGRDRLTQDLNAFPSR